MNKVLKSTLISMSILSLASCSGTPTGTNNTTYNGSNFGLKALIVTKILPDRTNVSSSLRWNGIGGADHYELSRIQDNGTKIGIGPTKITNTTLTFSDSDLKENSSYQYSIDAVDSNNRLISSDKTGNIMPINSTNLQATTIFDLKLNETNSINRDTTIKWSSVADVDLYYTSISNDSTSKQIFGVFTKNTSVNLNLATSPENPPQLIKDQLPIFTNGLEPAVRHRLSVYTIKSDNKDFEKATAIGIRQSTEVKIII